MTATNRTIFRSDCLDVLDDPELLANQSVDLIYLDPPFNSKKKYALPFDSKGKDVEAVVAFTDTWTWGDAEKQQYQAWQKHAATDFTVDFIVSVIDYCLKMRGTKGKDNLAAYLLNMAARLLPTRRLLKESGSIFLHCDPTASHYLKLIMDAIFDSNFFQNEIIWHYGLGGSSRKKYSRKHDVILMYSRSNDFYFDKPLVPATSQRMKGELKGATDVWDIPSINNMSHERLGYPTQKPLALLERIVKASCPEGGLVLDPFCGCGTTLHAAESLNRRWIGIDISRFSAGLVRDRLLSHFKTLTSSDISVAGVPLTVDEARSLAAHDPFEFEKWVCGHLGAAGIYTKKKPGQRGPDGGVDGILRFWPFRMDGDPTEHELAVVQVKSGNVSADSVRALYQTVEDIPGATAGVLVCFEDQMSTVENNRSKHTFSDQQPATYQVIQGLSVEEMLRGGRPNLPNIIKRGGKTEAVPVPSPSPLL